MSYTPDTWTPTEIRAWVDRNGGNVSACARDLGVGRTYLQDLLSGRKTPSGQLVESMRKTDRLRELTA